MQVSWREPALEEWHDIGGVKESGQGREGGIEGLDNYIELKTIHFA